MAEDFHVCAVIGAEGVYFDGATQTVRAALLDGRGQRLLLAHPYTSRGQAVPRRCWLVCSCNPAICDSSRGRCNAAFWDW